MSIIYICSVQSPGSMEQSQSQKVTPTPKTIHIARQHKADLNESWTFRWVNTPFNPRSGHHAANKTPPLTTPSEPFRSLNRRTFSRLIQFKTGHAHTGEYCKKFVLSEEQGCRCGAQLRTRQHIIFDSCHAPSPPGQQKTGMARISHEQQVRNKETGQLTQENEGP